MTKFETKMVEQAKRTGSPVVMGRTLASLHRAAGTTRSQRELAALIEGSPEIRAAVTFDGGVYIAIA